MTNREFTATRTMLENAMATAPAKLSIERIIELHDESTDRDFGLLIEPFARAIEREVLGAHAGVVTGGGITAAQFEEIAKGWDGCRYDDAMIDDIGAALRADFKRLASSAAQDPVQHDEEVRRALEQAAQIVIKRTRVPRDLLGTPTSAMKAAAEKGGRIADAIRSLATKEGGAA